MSFRKNRSIQVSEMVFNIVCDELDMEVSELGTEIYGWLETFNNCREQGYYLCVRSSTNYTKQPIFIWVFEARNSDDIVVVWQTRHPKNGMFDEDSYEERNKHFKVDHFAEAATFIFEKVSEYFEEEFEK